MSAVPKVTDKQLDSLRSRLLTAQTRLTDEKHCALAVIVTGMPSAGRSEVVNKFLQWLDPKRIKVYALNHLRRGRMSAPPLQRYWPTLPARGEIAIYFLGWYEDYLAPALHSPRRAQREAARVTARIRQLETMLSHDRLRVLKLHLRVDRATQKHRIAALRADKATRWRVTPEERWLAKHHGRVRKTMERLIEATNLPVAPWHVIDGTDEDGRLYEAGSLLLSALHADAHTEHKAAAMRRSAARKAPLSELLVTQGATLDDDEYGRELLELQGRLARLSRKKPFAKRSVVLAFEGMDAAGKGGAIRRLTAALDARQYTVVPVSAPTPEELAHPYLWRFWRHVPERGEFAIFDRSWYGRVLVERVRGLTPAADWRRAYGEINEFELQFVEAGAIVHKFWLAVGKDEQLQRLEARKNDSLKRFKVDAEDWANRRCYDQYQIAASDMIARTSTEHAPWTIVAADNKRHARLKVLRTACEAIQNALDA